jgi:hypothetical protein
VGNNSAIAYSADGEIWSRVIDSTFGSRSNDSINAVAWGNGRFVAVGYRGKVAYSSGGAVFTEKPFEIDGVYEIIAAYSLLYNDGIRKIETEKLGGESDC